MIHLYVSRLTRCVPVYQRSSIQVLTQFTAQDSHSRTTYLLGSSDWFVDVTELVLKLLRIEDPEVASFGAQNSLIGLQPGKTSLHVGESLLEDIHLLNFLHILIVSFRSSLSSGMVCWADVISR